MEHKEWRERPGFRDFLDPRGHKEFRGFKDLWVDRLDRMESMDRKAV
jgi:hypothetical protein